MSRLSSSPMDAQMWGALSQSRAGRAPTVGECELWPMRIADAPVDWGLLTAGERARAERFQVDDARRVFLASRIAQRLLGAHYLGGHPRDVVIERGCEHCEGFHGRPKFVRAGVDYSVSHTGEWLVIAVVGTGRIGVDVEYVPRALRDLERIAWTVLTRAEWVAYEALSATDRTRWFYRSWTRKEAAVKLTGHGLIDRLSELNVQGPLLSALAVPQGWPVGSIHLQDVSSPADYLAALASTEPLTAVRICLPSDVIGKV